MTDFSGSGSASKAIALQGNSRELFVFTLAGSKHRLGRLNSDVKVQGYTVLHSRLTEEGAAEKITLRQPWCAGDYDVPCLGLSQNPPWLLPAPWERPDSQSAWETCVRQRLVVRHRNTAEKLLVDDVVSTILL